MLKERFSFSRILLVFAFVVTLMALPSIGYTMSYDQGFVDGESNQVSQLQTEISILSARMGEMEADLFRVGEDFSADMNSSKTIELSSVRPTNDGAKCNGNAMFMCYKQPEVGWQYIF